MKKILRFTKRGVVFAVPMLLIGETAHAGLDAATLTALGDAMGQAEADILAIAGFVLPVLATMWGLRKGVKFTNRS